MKFLNSYEIDQEYEELQIMHLNVSLSLGLGEENNTFEACCDLP